MEHYRCGEISDTIYLIAPDDITEEQLNLDIKNSMNSYLEAQEKLKSASSPGDWFDSNIDKYPDNITVGEIKQKRNEFNNKQDKFLKIQRDAKSFTAYMNELGYRLLYDLDEDMGEIICGCVDWGHRHGEIMRY